MRQVIKYKIYYLISKKYIASFALLLVFLFNFHAVLNSGILLSGGANFNRVLKYELILNNYLLVSSIYGLLFSIYLGSSIVGPDIRTGNIQVILTSFSSRTKYYVGTYLGVFLFMFTFQLLILFNITALFIVFDVPFIGAEVLTCFIATVLNATVVLSITGIASIFMEGYQSAIVGLLSYTFFSVYTYNVVPFVNTSFIFDITKYRNLLWNFVPITNILPASYTAPNIIEAYSIHPIIPNVHCYQFLYSVFGVMLGALCFRHHEL